MSHQPLSIRGKRKRQQGLTMVEVMVSIFILSIGLLGVALFIGTTVVAGNRAKYMSMANVLASEKLDNLNKWPTSDTSCDPNVCPGGSLTGPSVCAAGDTYCDQITVNAASGVDYETQTEMVGTPPAPVTTTIVHTSSGCVDTPANCGVPAPPGGGSTFTRRWLITADPTITSTAGTSTITGARRITVVVTLNNQPANAPVTFQMSMVRP